MIAQDKLVKAVGAGNVSREAAALEAYAGDMSFVNRVRPDCVVKIKDPAAVSKLVKLARQTQTPLVPVSSGAPHFRGDTVPGTGGAVIVDMSGLKKIIRVDRLNRVAMFEPGVTYGELIPAAARQGLRLNLPLLPRKTKSVVGSLLEREPVIMPKFQWDISDPLSCMEIIFGTGDMYRTGAAAGPGSLEEQWAAGGAQKEGAGPSASSWYRIIQGAQGTMGIVTWASVRCEIAPTISQPYLVGSHNLDRLTDLAHWLVRLRIADELLVLNSTELAAIVAKKPAEAKAVRDSLPPWVLFFNIGGYEYFPEDRVAGLTQDMRETAQRLGLEPAQVVGKVAAQELLETLRGVSPEPYWKLRAKGGCQDIFFITIYDKLNELISIMQQAADAAGYPAADIGVYVQPVVQGTSCHCEFNLPYDPDDPRETARVRKLSAGVLNSLIAAGAFFSRPYGELTGAIINRDAATVAALQKVKTILDPDNLMNPGKLCF